MYFGKEEQKRCRRCGGRLDSDDLIYLGAHPSDGDCISALRAALLALKRENETLKRRLEIKRAGKSKIQLQPVDL